jgi:hypothetical protein
MKIYENFWYHEILLTYMKFQVVFDNASHFHPSKLFTSKARSVTLEWIPEAIFLVACDPSMSELWVT